MTVRRVFQGLLLIAVGALASLVIALGRGHNTLLERYDRLRKIASEAHLGMYVPATTARTIEGDSIALAAGRPEQRQLLYFLTTSCPYCRASIPAWRRLAAEADGLENVTVVGIVIDSAHLASAYRRAHKLRFPIVALLDRRTTALFKATRVPLTMVVDGGGRVLFARVGELVESPGVDSVRQALSAPAPWAAAAGEPLVSRSEPS